MKPRNLPPARNGLRECRECRAGGHSAKANVGIEYLDIDVELANRLRPLRPPRKVMMTRLTSGKEKRKLSLGWGK